MAAAESYDWLSFVGREVKRPDVAASRPDRVATKSSRKEHVLFKGLRAYFDK